MQLNGCHLSVAEMSVSQFTRRDTPKRHSWHMQRIQSPLRHGSKSGRIELATSSYAADVWHPFSCTTRQAVVGALDKPGEKKSHPQPTACEFGPDWGCATDSPLGAPYEPVFIRLRTRQPSVRQRLRAVLGDSVMGDDDLGGRRSIERDYFPPR